jgi:phosphomannomutase
MQAIRTLKISISGIRGVVGDSLTPDLLVRFAESFGTYVNGGVVVLATDTRTSREMVKHAVLAGLASTGCQIVDIGIAPVPTLQVAVERLHAAGGVCVTASHNPAEWNALKFIRGDGIFLSDYQAEEVLDIYHQGSYRRAASGALSPARTYNRAPQDHIEAVMRHLDLDLLRQRRLKVVADCCNGAGSVMTRQFLEALGCDVVVINDDTHGIFPHNPEPIPENLVQLSEAVRREGADVGFVQDADADRLALCDETGLPIGEEYTVSLATEFVLRHTPGPVAVNVCTTSLVDDIARGHGCPVIRTKVGEVNVAETMRSRGAVIGGEGSGGVIWSAIHFGRDSYSGMGAILQLLAESGKTVSELVAAFPRYTMLKTKIACPSDLANTGMKGVRALWQSREMDLQDGLKVLLNDGAWFNVRGSRTEPVVRVTSEAPSASQAEELQEQVVRQLREVCGL